MSIEQRIENSPSVTVNASSVIPVEPDMVSLQFSVIQFKPTPREALNATREDARKVQIYLQKAGINDVKSSHIELRERSSHSYTGPGPEGYEAELKYYVLLDDVNRLEEILVGVVEAGAHQIYNANFETTQLKRLRQEARQQAIHAARDKAELYCQAAGAELGQVLQIEELNYGSLRRAPGGTQKTDSDYDDIPRVLNPASIEVHVNVRVSYAIRS